MKTFLLIICLSSSALGAACPKLGSRYYCDNSGSESANRTAFVDTLAAMDCGETLVLKADTEIVTERTSKSGYLWVGNSFYLPVKNTTACSSGKYMLIKSSRADELPQGVRVSPSDAPKMARISVNHTYPMIMMPARSHHIIFEGIHFTTTADIDSGCNANPTVTDCSIATYFIQPASAYAPEASPHHIVFDRILCAPYNPNSAFGSALGCMQLNVSDVTVKNSYVYGFSGWLVNSYQLNPLQQNVTNVSASTSPVLSLSPGASGLSGKYLYEVGGFTGDWAILNGSKVISPISSTTLQGVSVITRISSISSGADPKTLEFTSVAEHNLQTGTKATVVVSGAVTGFSCLNGQNITLTRVNEYKVTASFSGCASSAYFFDDTDGLDIYLAVDTTGLSGPSTGWVRAAERGNYYGIWTDGGPGPITLENNYIQAQFANSFFGGSSIGAPARQAYTASVVSVDTPNTVFTLTHVNGLNVGDMFSAYTVSGVCQGKILAINGKQITTTGTGSLRPSNGCTFAAGNSVLWNGYTIERIKLVRNTFDLLQRTSLMGHKGGVEVKTGSDWLILGNQFTGEDDSPYMFWTVRNDQSNSQGVWVTAEGMHFISNITHSGISNFSPVDDQDGIATQRQIGGKYNPMVFKNNLHFQALGRAFSTVRGNGSIVMEHNTFISQGTTRRGDKGTGINAIAYGQDCGPSPKGVRPFRFYSNILNYGSYGYSGASDCWDLTKRGNVYVDTVSQNPYWENAPNNQISASVASLTLSGTCDYQGDNWQNCSLGGGSTYKNDGDDGKDPGVDMDELKDDVNGWSVKAGLAVEDPYRKKLANPSAFNIGSTRASINFTVIQGGTCELVLYTNSARTVEHGDTNTSGEKLCTRSGNVTDSGKVSFVLGTNTSLTPSTTYYYKLTMGNSVVVGQIMTRESGSGNYSWKWSRAMECGTDGSTFGTSVSSGTAYSVATGQVRYCRESNPIGPTQVLVAP